MTIFAWRSTVQRLHLKVQRNIVRNHQARYESSKTNSTPSRNVSTNAPATNTTPQWNWMDPVLRPFRAYDQMQKRSPLMTQWESALIIYYLGDLTSQAIVTNNFENERYEPIRGLRAMAIGAIAAIPGYKWFNFLGDHFNYKSHIFSLCVKIGIHQAFFVPAFNAYFFAMQPLLAGGSWKDAKERVKNTVPTSWLKSCQFWPIVNAFNFTFVPWQYRNVFAGTIAIGWQGYLSWLNRTDENRSNTEQRKEKKEQQAVPSSKTKQSNSSKRGQKT